MTLDTLAAEFVRYWTTDRTPDGCGMCGGIPHSTTCYVGRMATLIGSATDSSQRSELLNGQERSAEQQTLQLPAEPQTPEPQPTFTEYRRVVEALNLCLAALDRHDGWCGHKKDSPGDSIYRRATDAARKALWPEPAAPVSSSARPDSATTEAEAFKAGYHGDHFKFYSWETAYAVYVSRKGAGNDVYGFHTSAD